MAEERLQKILSKAGVASRRKAEQMMQEGRVTLRQVEEARVMENDKWIAFYDAQYASERARWAVLRLTGDLMGAVEALP